MKQIKSVDCFACGKKKLTKDEVGLNKKMIGKEIKQFYCIDCFAEYLAVSTEALLAKIEEFKEQGCNLF
ncbi:MAG: hypothetical protein BWY74_01993 [Firmicutes bacterium ADurb.Bin419]|nr:MAG: hypothetical protein BWY74_01993 [Firmicutes bacterium ADurb.Bin419]